MIVPHVGNGVWRICLRMNLRPAFRAVNRRIR
jgi:hypothetical protein